MDLSEYRNRPVEHARVSSLLSLVPEEARSALDVGARDGQVAVLLADRVGSVVALDLELPKTEDPRVVCVPASSTYLGAINAMLRYLAAWAASKHALRADLLDFQDNC